MLTSHHQLTQAQFDQLQLLTQRCQIVDGNKVPLYSQILYQYRSLPCNLLYYHQTELVGFLSIFFFYDNACEITLMVDPALRRQGIAAQLMTTILPIIHSRNVEHLLFPSPKGLNDSWLPERGLTYHNTEIQMQWEGVTTPLLNPPNCTFRPVQGDEDVSCLVDIDMLCFNTEKNEMQMRYHRLLSDTSYTILIIQRDNEAIGKAHFHQETNQIQLSDIAILPRYQGSGFGQELVAHCIHYASSLSELPLRLDVESNNDNAIHIYQKLGFKIINTWDYWTISAILFNSVFHGKKDC